MRRVFFAVLLAASVFIPGTATAQKKVVIMGSSTAAGIGATLYSLSWVGKLITYYNKNNADGKDTTFTNIAWGGYDTYHEMYTGFVPPPPRGLPDPEHNITKAISLAPDIIIINLPSNDMYNGLSKATTMFNFRSMFNLANAANIKCYIATTQPRMDLDDLHRAWQRDLRDSIMTVFGNYGINFWDDLVTLDGLNNLRPEVKDPNSFYHINNLGHDYLYNRVLNRNIFAENGPTLPIHLLDFQASASDHAVTVKWRTEDEDPNTFFELQRKGSSTGASFDQVNRQAARVTGQVADYSWVDQNPLPGQSFYRLKIIEPNRETYSRIASVMSKVRSLNINKLYKNNSSTSLVAEISVLQNQLVNVDIIDMGGALIKKISQAMSAPSTTITLPIGDLAAGQYFLRLRGADNSTAVKAFTK